jgi:chaperone modulatory protein CbpM
MSDPVDTLTLEELCSVCALERDWLVVRVREGLIPASGSGDARSADTAWRFTTTTLARVRRMREIERTYDAAPELAALVADLLEEMDSLRARLRLIGR